MSRSGEGDDNPMPEDMTETRMPPTHDADIGPSQETTPRLDVKPRDAEAGPRTHIFEANDVEDSHVDCIQTFAVDLPGSSNVVIQGNRCEGIRAQCLMAEGPDTADGSGEGVSRNWLFRGNYCDAYAKAQSVAFVDIQDVTITENEMAGKANKAFALGKDSTGAVVKDNRIDEDYGREVGFDDPSAQQGYQGPPAR